MSQRFLFDEDYGWPIRTLRAVVWSAMMAVLWVVPSLAFSVLCLIFTASPSDAEEYGGLGVALMMMWLMGLVGASFLLGAVIGFSAAMEARPEEPFWPSRVPHFRTCFGWSMGILLAITGGAFAVALSNSLL